MSAAVVEFPIGASYQDQTDQVAIELVADMEEQPPDAVRDLEPDKNQPSRKTRV